jgi:hypothetical protein
VAALIGFRLLSAPVASLPADPTTTTTTAIAPTPSTIARVTEQEAPLPTILPEQTVMAIAAAPTVTPSATLMPTSQVICTQAVNSRLALVYKQNDLGCAKTEGAVVWAAWQPFERGYMLWRQDENQSYAIFDGGAWAAIAERWSGQAIAGRGTPPPELWAPEREFGYAWGMNDDLFNRLGWAKTKEKGFCAFIQLFEHGFILQSYDSIEFCQDELDNYARSSDWTPILFAFTDDGRWRQP